ncbi:MAG: HAMP domain-containing histidine kinase [Clostridia bacterium]|nr:HAMP domain-containing histidine kinase [Clostridia bacterium]
MKFFERTYLLTLVLFLVFLNGCILMLTLYSYERRVDATEQVCLSEQYTIRQAFEDDYDGTGNGSDLILQTTYGSFYQKKGIRLCFTDAMGEIRYSTLPAGLQIPEAGKLIQGKSEDGVRYVLISETICDGAFTLTYAKDISEMDEEFHQLFIMFLGVSVASSTLLALFLHLVLRRLYAPLDKLRSVTEQLSRGNFSVRAEERGGDEFALLGADFNRMADQINAQMNELKTTADQKQRMLDDLAHEMRTPLMSIHGYAEYISNANIPEEERIDSAQCIMQESLRLRSISETLLDMAFVRENKIHPAPLATRVLLSNTWDRFQLRAQACGIELTCHEELPILWGDELLLELLLSNLTENALKACREGGRIEIGAREEDGAVMLYVKDNGIGLTNEQLVHITEPFYRTDRARSRSGGGTGLGLALCARIAKAHGGRLEFLSAPGCGCEARAYLDVRELPEAT